MSKQITDQRRPMTYQELLAVWRACLTRTGFTDPHESVIDELVAYSGLPEDRVRWISEHSSEISQEKWVGIDKSSPESMATFYQRLDNLIFGTLRYHAEQALGRAQAKTVEVAQGLAHLTPGAYLDFGCGAGTAGLFFHALGWKVALADVSEPSLNFVRWRFQQRQIPGTFYHLGNDDLPANAFDLITAVEVMVHIPDIQGALRQLHRSLKPGGLLVFDIDNRPSSDPDKWHLYTEQYPVLRQVRRAGFRRCPRIAQFHVYQKVDRSLLSTVIVGLLDTLRYNRLTSTIGRQLRGMKYAARHVY